MITIQETLVVDDAGRAVLNLPRSVKPGVHQVLIQIEETENSSAERRSLIGLWQGKITFNPGWDDPLEDFSEYTK